ILSAITERGVLTRLTLKGRFIWSRNDPTLFLDGEAFGQSSAGNGSSVALRLPSGDRRLGRDFEMWVWLVGAPSFITDIQVSPSTEIIVGDTVTVTMTLSAPAPANSVIALVITNANVTVSATPRVTSPPTSPPAFGAVVPVATGSPTASFTATGRVAGDPTIIQASFGGQKASVTLVVKAPPNLTGVVILTPSSINVGAFSTGTVTINRPAPSKGFVVAVRSGDPAIAEVQQANVTVDPGKTTATFQVRGRAPSGDQGVDIIAQAGNVTVTGNLVVRTRKTLGKIESKERLGKEVGSKEGAAAIEKLPSGREVISPFTRTINKLT